MQSSFALALLLAASGVTASPAKVQERQATDDAAFSAAASQFISGYIPPSAFSVLSVSVASAAAAAGVTGDAGSLIYSVLEATSTPAWWSSAVPTAYSSDIAAINSEVSKLRPAGPTLAPGSGGISLSSSGSGSATGTAAPSSSVSSLLPAGPTAVQTVVVVTTTDSAGHTVTTSYTAAVTAAPAPPGTASVVTTTDSAGSTYTTTLVAGGVGGGVSSSTSGSGSGNGTAPNTTGSTTTTGSASPSGSGSAKSSSSTAGAAAAVPTAGVFGQAAAGLAAIVGLVAAL